jgi:hypothetical protein
MRSVARI